MTRRDNTGEGAHYGICTVDRLEAMRVFDALPRAIREAIANARFNWSPQDVRMLLQRFPAHEIPKLVTRADLLSSRRDEIE